MPFSILLIEDSNDVSHLMEAILLEEGYTVWCASKGGDAVNILASGKVPDLVLMDLSLPDMNADQLAERLRALDRLNDDSSAGRRGRPMALLVCSANQDIATRAETLRADGYIRKPMQIDRFLEEVARHLPNSKKQPLLMEKPHWEG